MPRPRHAASLWFLGVVAALALHGCDGRSGTSRKPNDHRAKAPSCILTSAVEPESTGYGGCKQNADCSGRANGMCVQSSGVGYASSRYYNCVYGCTKDSDCADDELCTCAEGGPGFCEHTGNCRIDADCGGGASSYCSQAYGGDCGGYHPATDHFCHTPKDTCIDDYDCSGDSYCDYDRVDGRWECKAPEMMCAIG